jgi:HJR/Mrr/RecB family endonuclease
LSERNPHRPHPREYFSKWESRPIPTELKAIARAAHSVIQNRVNELRKQAREREAQSIVTRVGEIVQRNDLLVRQFVEVAYRKAVPDEYGDENVSALMAEIARVTDKIRTRDAVFRDLEWKHRLVSGHSPAGVLSTLLHERFAAYKDNRRKMASSLDAVRVAEMSGSEFEAHVCDLLRSSGIGDVAATPATGDQGGDILFSISGRRYVIQAKRYKGSVGNKAVQEAYAARAFYGCDEAWVVTNSQFTPSARVLANEPDFSNFLSSRVKAPPEHPVY